MSGLTARIRLLDGLGVGSGKAGEGEADRARRLPDAREVNVGFATAAAEGYESRHGRAAGGGGGGWGRAKRQMARRGQKPAEQDSGWMGGARDGVEDGTGADRSGGEGREGGMGSSGVGGGGEKERGRQGWMAW